MALNMPLFAQFGYWYHTDFIELSSKNDSIYYLYFKDKTPQNKEKQSPPQDGLRASIL